MASAPAVAADDKIEAVILSVSNNQISARSREGPLTVVVTPKTEIKETSGVLSKTTRDAKSLIPGLIFTVEGPQTGNTVTAYEIKFKKSDWRAAVATKAGTTEQFTELRQAIIDGQEYVIREQTTVYFATGKFNVADEYKADLRALAQKAPGLGNYRVSILGFADSTGNAEANEKLSMRRAAAVSAFVRQTPPIEPGRVLAPSPMGEGTTAPGESPPTSNDEARRVLVRLITPKGQLTQ